MNELLGDNNIQVCLICTVTVIKDGASNPLPDTCHPQLTGHHQKENYALHGTGWLYTPKTELIPILLKVAVNMCLTEETS